MNLSTPLRVNVPTVPGANSLADQPINGTTDQRINGSTDQPINRSTDQRINRSTDQPINGPTDQRINRSTDQPINGPTDQRTNRSTDQRNNPSTASGITLIELLVVVAIVGLMLAISFPTLTTGLDGFRLRAAVDRAGSLFQHARLEADRRQQPVQFTADPRANQLRALAADASWRETLEFEAGVRMVQPAGERHWMLYPSTPPPQVRLMLEAQTGGRRGLSINVFTGVAEDWKGSAGP